MTRTLRIAKKKSKNPNEKFPTPEWCVHRFLEFVDLPGGCWLEPAAGNGAIIRAVNSFRSDVSWVTNDISPWKENDLKPDTIGDYLFFNGLIVDERMPENGFDVTFSNPPFSKLLEFVQISLKKSKIVVMLGRLNWLGSDKRRDWLVETNPDVYVLPDRPKFGKEHSDACEYSWFCWNGPHGGGRYFILEKTPVEIRKRDEEMILR